MFSDHPPNGRSGLLPLSLRWHGQIPLVSLGTVPLAAFARPFIDDAFSAARITGFEALDALSDAPGRLSIAGAIHHMSRCGSTLMCRQLSALPRIFAASEPFIFQQLLEGPPASPAVTRQRLRKLAAMLCRGMAAHADRLVIKWPTLVSQHAATLAAAFPEVPMIFLHRDPIEVLESIARAPLGNMERLSATHMLGGDVGPFHDPIERAARTLGKNCVAAAGAANLRTLAYERLPDATLTDVACYFGIDVGPAGLQAMRSASLLHSKANPITEPANRFVNDSESKRREASANVRTLAGTILGPARDLLVRHTPML